MAFIRPSLNQLIVRIENDLTSRLTGSAPLLSRALIKILARVLAGGWDSVYSQQKDISDSQLLLQNADNATARRWAFQWGVNIKEAAFASGLVRFTGVDTTVIPQNTLVARSDGVEFITTANGTISGGVVDITVQAVNAGSLGNTPGSTILTLVSPIVDVNDTVTVQAGGLVGGDDGDTTEDIINNVLNRIQLPPKGGSLNDYKTIAEAVNGVDKAFPFENQAGPAQVLGSVTTVIKGVSPIEPSASLIANVLAALNDADFKPLTSTQFVNGIVSKEVDYEISITPNDATIKDNILNNLTNQMEADAIPGGTILISHIRNAISTSGVTDYVIDQIDVESQGSVPVDQDINFTNFDYPFVNSVSFNTLL